MIITIIYPTVNMSGFCLNILGCQQGSRSSQNECFMLNRSYFFTHDLVYLRVSDATVHQ